MRFSGKSWGREVELSTVFLPQFFHEVHIQKGHMKYSFA